MKFVLDASVAIRWLVRKEQHPHADAIRRRLLGRPSGFAAPELFLYETFSVLQRIHPQPLKVFETAVLPLVTMGVLRYPMTPGISKRAQAYCALGLRGYDAVYAALAEELGGIWLTFDSKAHRTIEARGVSCDLNAALPPGLAEPIA